MEPHQLARRHAANDSRCSRSAATAAVNCTRTPTSTCSILVDGDPAEYRDGIETFVQNLWDLKLDIGHSVRTIDQCQQEAKDDIATATSILERRLLAGTLALDRQVGRLFATDEIWPSARFFSAKVDEQRKRHDRYQDVDYNLEPNIKVAPGGLRDIQTVGWIIKRHFGNTSADDLTGARLPDGAGTAMAERRPAIPVAGPLRPAPVAGRVGRPAAVRLSAHPRDRLGYTDTEAQLGVEQFMHDYYSHVLSLREVNDILLQHFDEAILRAHYEPEIEPINERFQIRDNYIETRDEDVFRAHPPALMEMFVIMANRRDISGVRATTIRQVRNHLDLIDEAFRNDPEVTGLFIDLLRAPYTLVSQLTRMRRYGVLGALHSRVRPRDRPDAARPVPHLHGRCAHDDGDPQHAATALSIEPGHVSGRLPLRQESAEDRTALHRGAVPRHREGARRRSLDARRASTSSRSAAATASTTPTPNSSRGSCACIC